MKINLILACFFGFTIQAVAQLDWHSLPGPYGGNVYPLDIDDSGTLITQFDGSIFISSNARQWTPIYDSAFTFKLGHDGKYYVSDRNSTVYVSSNQGATWRALPKSKPNWDLATTAIDRNSVFYVAEGDRVFISNDDGQSWQDAGFDFEGAAQHIRLDSENTIFVYGNSSVFKSEDNGVSWHPVYEKGASIRYLFVASNNTLILGTDEGATGTTYQSLDNGVSWQSTNFPNVQNLYESPQGWLFGITTTPEVSGEGAVFFSTNNGSSWRSVNIGIPVFDVAVGTDGVIYFATQDGVAVSTDNGASFRTVSPARARVETVVSPASHQLLAVTTFGDQKWRLWRSNDQGASWTELNQQHLFGASAVYVDLIRMPQTRVWLLLGYNTTGDDRLDKNKIYETQDGGSTWRLKQEFDAAHLGVDFDRESSLVYAWDRGASFFYRSNDFGASWLPKSVNFPIGRLSAAAHGLIYAYSGTDNSGAYTRVHRSFDSGDTWQAVNEMNLETNEHAVLQSNRFGDLFRLDVRWDETSTTFRIVRFLRSSDYGITWENIFPDNAAWNTEMVDLPNVHFDSNGALMVRTSTSIFLSTDNGDSFQEIYHANTASEQAQCVFASDTGTLFVGTAQRSLQHSPLFQHRFKTRFIAGPEFPLKKTYGIQWIDYNSDGLDDLYLVGDGQNSLFRNTGKGRMQKVNLGAIVMDNEPSRAATWGDYTGDGYPECFVSNAEGNNSLYVNNGDGSFTKKTSGNIVEDFGTFRSTSWVDVNNDGHLDLYVTNRNGANVLYMFIPTDDGGGYHVRQRSVIDGDADDQSYGCAWSDYDNDGDADLYVANGGEDRFYEQVAVGQFQLLGEAHIQANSATAVGCSWADFNNDGHMDLFVANADAPNKLYVNNGDKTFTTRHMDGTPMEDGVSKGSAWGDYDNDGDVDLFVSNNGSFLFYINNGAGSFERLPVTDFVYFASNSLSTAWGDLENDGDLDLVVSSYDHKTMLYENRGNSNHWIKIVCEGNVSNKSGIGAKVHVKATIHGKPVWQMREISSQSGHASQNSFVQHFGLGNASRVDSIVVIWPSGSRQVLVQQAADQRITVIEHNDTSVQQPLHMPEVFALHPNYPNPFNSSTQFRFDVPRPTRVSLEIFDANGRLVKRLLEDTRNAGSYTVVWDGTTDSGMAVPSGLYFCRMQTEIFEQVRKITLLR